MKVFLETDRLILRELTPEDVDNLFALDNDPEVMRLINGGHPVPYEVIRDQNLPRYLLGSVDGTGYGFYAAIEKTTGNFLGWFCFRPPPGRPDDVELGYRLHKTAWGKGYATEGSRALIRKGFTEMGTRRVIAHTLEQNVVSRRVMEKAGLHFARRFNYEGAPGAWHVGMAAVEYVLDRGDYESRQAAARH